MKDPLVAGNAGQVFQNISAVSEKERMMFPGALYRFGRCLVIEDTRYPTITLGGSAGSYTLTPRYKLPGRDPDVSDPRDKTLNARQVGYLLGKASLAKWQPEKWHYEYEYEQYDKFGGQGVFNSSGFQMVQWDFGTTDPVNPATSTTRQQDSSVVLLFSTPPLLT